MTWPLIHLLPINIARSPAPGDELPFPMDVDRTHTFGEVLLLLLLQVALVDFCLFFSICFGSLVNFFLLSGHSQNKTRKAFASRKDLGQGKRPKWRVPDAPAAPCHHLVGRFSKCQTSLMAISNLFHCVTSDRRSAHGFLESLHVTRLIGGA